MLRILLATAAGLLLTATASAQWPTYRGDAARRGFTKNSLPKTMAPAWVFNADHPPRPAWPRSARMPYDRAFHVVAKDDLVFFGSNVDGTLYALDARRGSVVWTHVTEGPIRFAPVIWRDYVLVASDDGTLRALRATDGKLVWQRRGGPDHRMVLGNGRMISKWPARGGPTVVEDTVYFAAGIWPSEGIYLYGLDAKTGQPRWQNDKAGAIYMPQPHGGANARSGVSAQGYLVATPQRLLVPTGRAVPASFDRVKGSFQYFHLQKYGHHGGSSALAAGEWFFNSGQAFDLATGTSRARIGPGPLAATADGLARAAKKSLSVMKWIDAARADRKGKKIPGRSLVVSKTIALPFEATSLIVAGNDAFVGGKGGVCRAALDDGRVDWSKPLPGTAWGLAASDGMLLASTDQGTIHCFARADPQKNAGRKPAAAGDAAPDKDGDLAAYRKSAVDIIQRTKITKGFCLDLQCGDGRLAEQLAKRTRLQIIACDSDPKNVQAAQRRFRRSGLLGHRVSVFHRQVDSTGFPKYFANVVVSGRTADRDVDRATETLTTVARQFQRPDGGKICFGKPGAMVVKTRSALAGAGNWTHQYGNAANTTCSDDTLVKGALGILWYRDVDFDVPQRHGRGPAPLYAQGRLFHEGTNGICAVDAYNGHLLWKYDIPGILKPYDGDELMGVAGTGSNYCTDGQAVYVRVGPRCLKISASTGELLNEFKVPNLPNGKSGPWGYIAVQRGIVYGSVANPDHIVTYRYVNRGGDMSRLLTESRSLFAMDANTGKVLWHYVAKHSIRHNAIAIGKDKTFLIDRPLAMFDRVKRPKTKSHPTGTLVALESSSGKRIWSTDEDIYGTMLAISDKHNSLLMSYQPTRFRLDSEIGGRMAVFEASTGKKRWEQKARYDSRPLINDKTIYAQGGGWDLLTGQARPFPLKRSYGCGVLAACREMMFFRSATLGYFDLKGKSEVQNFGGMRPGCWINAIPAGGLVLVPDASAGCACSYLNRTWLALQPE